MWRIATSATLAICLGSAASAQGSPANGDALVIIGAGAAGTWATEYEFANRDSSPAQVQVGPAPFSIPCAPLQGCEQATITVSGRGIAKIPSLPYTRTFVGSTFVVSDGNLPTVRARIVNTAIPTQAIELPATRLSTILALNPPELVFPTLTRTGEAHSNLVLSELTRLSPIEIRVEAYSPEGILRGSRTYELASGGSLFLVDVLQELAISTLAEGQLRVIKTGGEGVLWGLLATVTHDAQVFVTLGRNP